MVSIAQSLALLADIIHFGMAEARNRQQVPEPEAWCDIRHEVMKRVIIYKCICR
jgi:hypothetical protein